MSTRRARALGPQAIHLIRETAKAAAEIEAAVNNAAQQQAPRRPPATKGRSSITTATTTKRRTLSDTELALHPLSNLRKCKCGTRYTPSSTKGDNAKQVPDVQPIVLV